MEKAHSLLSTKLQVNYIILSPFCQPNFNEIFNSRVRKDAYFASEKETDRVHFDEHSLFDQLQV
jgi:hypothetical protein